jgi:TolA-binding protein
MKIFTFFRSGLFGADRSFYFALRQALLFLSYMSLKHLARNTSLLPLLCCLASCATHPAPAPAPPPETSKVEDDNTQTRELITKMQDKIQDLETRISALNEKINVQNGGPSSNTATTELPMQMVQKPVADTNAIPHSKVNTRGKTPSKKEAAVAEEPASTEAVDRYREAKILYDSKRYSDAVLEFAEFVKNEPDHALAPAAQYYVGMSYYQQKEYKLAEEELSRGLVSYPHSNYVPDYLLGLSKTSEALGKNDKVIYFKQKLLSAFPNSPQAKGVKVSESPVKKSTMAEPEAVQPAVEKAEQPESPSPPTPPNSPEAEPKIIGGST